MTNQLIFRSPNLREASTQGKRTSYLLLQVIYYSGLLNVLLGGGWKYFHFFVIVFFSLHLVWTRSIAFIDYLIFAFVAFFSVHGYLNENFAPYWMMDNVFFLLSTVVLFNRRENAFKDFTSEVPNMVASWLVLGTILSWYIMIEIGLQPSEIGKRIVRVETDELGLASFDILSPLYPALFIAPFYKYVSGNRKYVIVFALMTFFVFSFFTATRGGIIASLLCFALVLFSFKGSSDGIGNLIRVLFLVVVAAAVVNGYYGAGKLEKAYNNVIFRFFDAKDFSSGRATEEQLLAQSLTSEEWVIGRGFGGANHTWIWRHLENGINIVHKGYLFLILKGGLLFLCLIYGLALLAFVRLIRRGKIYYPFAFNIFLFLMLDQLHAQWLNLFACLFFWFSVSIGLNRNLTIARWRLY